MRALAFAIFLLTSVTHAHSINVFAMVEGKQITGYAYAAGGKRIADTAIEVHAGENHLATLKTDANGEFAWEVPKAADYRILLKAKDGHAAEYHVPRTDFASPEPNQTFSEDVPVLKAQIAALKRQVATSQSKSRLRDALGGVGFIFGIMGVLLYLKSRKRRVQ